MIEQSLLRAYRNRWQAVAEIEALEQRNKSVTERWRQLNALLRLAVALGLPLDQNDSLEDITYLRWMRLRDIYLERSEGSV